jgi:hypothetical protein
VVLKIQTPTRKTIKITMGENRLATLPLSFASLEGPTEVER